MKLTLRIKAVSYFDEKEMIQWINSSEAQKRRGLKAIEAEITDILRDQGAEIVEVKAEVTGDDETND